MRLHVKVECENAVQHALIRVATSGCEMLDQKSSKTITSRFIKDKVYRLLAVRVQGIVYKKGELIFQVDSHEKLQILKKNHARITHYLRGVTKNVPDYKKKQLKKEVDVDYKRHSTEETLSGTIF